MKQIPIAARHQRGAVSAFFGGGSGGEKVVRLEPWGFGVCKPTCGDEFGQYIELLDQLIIKLPPGLVSGKQFMALRRRLQTVPADDDGAGLLACVEP